MLPRPSEEAVARRVVPLASDEVSRARVLRHDVAAHGLAASGVALRPASRHGECRSQHLLHASGSGDPCWLLRCTGRDKSACSSRGCSLLHRGNHPCSGRCWKCCRLCRANCASLSGEVLETLRRDCCHHLWLGNTEDHSPWAVVLGKPCKSNRPSKKAGASYRRPTHGRWGCGVFSALQSWDIHCSWRGVLAGAGFLGNVVAVNVCAGIQSPPGSCIAWCLSWKDSVSDREGGHCNPLGIRVYSLGCGILSPSHLLTCERTVTMNGQALGPP